jgi:hypothetical protein
MIAESRARRPHLEVDRGRRNPIEPPVSQRLGVPERQGRLVLVDLPNTHVLGDRALAERLLGLGANPHVGSAFLQWRHGSPRRVAVQSD